jgi:3-deoxy-D-manno-oct-2-ulosonic acid (Kdo) hydroxylase
MSRVTPFDLESWTVRPSSTQAATTALEAGDVLFFPGLGFEIRPSELALFSPEIAAAAKNVSFDPRTGRLAGTGLQGTRASDLNDLVSRFADIATSFVKNLFPVYDGRIEIGRTSFRPVEIEGRASSWRKDDTRLHIDSFPATPVGDRRILRVFCNVNPQGRPRIWRIGGEFEQVAQRFSGRWRMPVPGSATLLRLLRITKSTRSRYDALMLQLHDLMKADTEYQLGAVQTRVEFPAGSTWIAFTDQVSHAAMAGQYQFEQTLLVPVGAMIDEQRSPLRILERITGRSLV